MNEDSINKKRNITLDVYKGVLIILVIIRHVLQYSVTDEGGILTNLIWAVQMPGFMLVSGYFSAKTIKSRSDVLRSIRKSLERYLLPFFSWWMLISIFLLGNYGRNPISGLVDLMQSVDKGLWFLWVIFVLSVIFTFCNNVIYRAKKLAGKVGGVIFVGCLFVGILLLIAKLAGINMLGVKFILYYSIFYGFGWLLHTTEQLWKPIFTEKVKSTMVFVDFVIFLSICFNYDLYRCNDDLLSIALRLVAGFTGNAVILATCEQFKNMLEKSKIAWIGTYTLEIYVTHMCVNNLFRQSNTYPFFTLAGFGNFAVSLICTVVFTTIMIAVIKSIPLANYILYGKRSK